MKIVGYDLFVDTLAKKLGGKYPVKTLKKVLQQYLSSHEGIDGYISDKIEFKDQFFGTFRFSDKGFEQYCEAMTEYMRQKFIHVDLAHETERNKKKLRKANKDRWPALNLVDGYKYVDKEKQKIRNQRAINSTKKIKYNQKKQSQQLKRERKIRNL